MRRILVSKERFVEYFKSKDLDGMRSIGIDIELESVKSYDTYMEARRRALGSGSELSYFWKFKLRPLIFPRTHDVTMRYFDASRYLINSILNNVIMEAGQEMGYVDWRVFVNIYKSPEENYPFWVF
jgi:hypothetical protein